MTATDTRSEARFIGCPGWCDGDHQLDLDWPTPDPEDIVSHHAKVISSAVVPDTTIKPTPLVSIEQPIYRDGTLGQVGLCVRAIEDLTPEQAEAFAKILKKAAKLACRIGQGAGIDAAEGIGPAIKTRGPGEASQQ